MGCQKALALLHQLYDHTTNCKLHLTKQSIDRTASSAKEQERDVSTGNIAMMQHV